MATRIGTRSDIVVETDKLGGQLGYGADGYYSTRFFHVQVPDDMGTEETRQYAALNAPGVPRRGELHPSVPIPVDDIRLEPLPSSSTQFLVTVTYKAPTTGGEDLEVGQTPLIAVSTGLQEIESHFDASGVQIATKHNAEGEPIPATISLQVPVMSVLYKRRELASSVKDPRLFIGRVNIESAFEGGARSWLCSRFDKETTDNGATYIVTYGFQYKEPYTLKKTNGNPIATDIPGWDMYVIEYDSEGNPVKDPVLNEGIKIIQPYRTAAFADLDLTYG